MRIEVSSVSAPEIKDTMAVTFVIQSLHDGMFESDFSECKGIDKPLFLQNNKIMKATEKSVSLLDGHYQMPLSWKVDWRNLPSNISVVETRLSI
ncbi:hypothetical protein T265_01848 [Opisthorchis viverrini]|uniref:Uncharacterized protein n=1 Tax=Opisthorchis viverrini TaxID=6198 RepID=A0A074ZYB9_OPIVI|nr:hypothetical protein T265_01848 [Opisthorchis viverrini]KER32076.1 hypothetical protein T265_01848 [Opisthorchis viverrini]